MPGGLCPTTTAAVPASLSPPADAVGLGTSSRVGSWVASSTEELRNMANEFSGSAVIDRPINEVFAFLADGTNDPRFSPRVQQIEKTTDGPVGVGTVFESKVRDAGMTTSRKFELTAFEAPTKIRWAERSKNVVTVPEGGYDLEAVGDAQTKVTIHNTFEGHGFGKLIVGFALRAAIKDAPDFAQRIKSAVEAA
jgi:uncharacterized protein YndB with AHSA1/START domain